jgi:hypothetical protein
MPDPVSELPTVLEGQPSKTRQLARQVAFLTPEVPTWELIDLSAVGLPAVPDAGDLDSVLV